MSHRTLLLVGLFVVGSGGAAGVACSSSSSTGSGDDSSAPMDAGGGLDSTTVTDSATHDTGTTFDTGVVDSGAALGDCSTVGGACDIVAQNCPSGQECDLTTGANGQTETACEPTQASESIQKGYPCCPGASNPCLPGLECNGQSECVDGGEPTGVCSARCCEGDDSVCGMTPGGIAGHCDIGVVDDDGGALYNICSYSASCKPFGVQPCTGGQECIVTDNAGTSTCTAIYNPPGIAAGGDCDAQNACASGDMCLMSGSATTGTCYTLCLVPNSTPPFSTTGLGTAPGNGGCPSSSPTCTAETSIFPAWLGICL